MARAARKSTGRSAKTSSRKTPAWKRPGSPIGRKGPRKANPKYKRNMRNPWTSADVRMLKELAKSNTPTGVISLKLGRPPAAIRSKAADEGISLKPVNRSPRTVRKTARKGASGARKSTRGSATRSRKAASTTRGRKGGAKRSPSMLTRMKRAMGMGGGGRPKRGRKRARR
jgi:hypothetical protein